MKLIVNPHKIELIQNQAVNEKEIDISKCEFEFADEITSDYVKEAYFTIGDNTYKQVIVNNECSFPQEVLVKPATIELGVVAYLVEDETEIKRYNPTPVYFKTDLGSLKQAQNSQPITPSEMEQYEQALQDGLSEVNDKLGDMDTALAEVDNLDIDASKVGTTTTVTITNKAGTTKSVQILDGINGTNGKDGVDGKDGKDGIDGKDGKDGKDGVDGTNGTNGRDGVIQYTAGDNITIENNVISATGGTTYTLNISTFNSSAPVISASDIGTILSTAYASGDYTPIIKIKATDSQRYGLVISSVSLIERPQNMAWAVYNSINATITLIEMTLSWNGSTCTVSNISYRNYYNLAPLSIEAEALATQSYVNDKFWVGTQQEYDDLETHDEGVFYFIKEN